MTTDPAPGAPSADRYAAVADVLRRYYEGLYRCDVALLQSVFHPEARYYTASGGELLHLDMDAYFRVVAARTPPQRSGDAYGFQIDAIEFAGPVTALARMRSVMLDKAFTDFLSLVRVGGEWRIVAKAFHYDVAPAGAA